MKPETLTPEQRAAAVLSHVEFELTTLLQEVRDQRAALQTAMNQPQISRPFLAFLRRFLHLQDGVARIVIYTGGRFHVQFYLHPRGLLTEAARSQFRLRARAEAFKSQLHWQEIEITRLPNGEPCVDISPSDRIPM